jgi:predicted permease
MYAFLPNCVPCDGVTYSSPGASTGMSMSNALGNFRYSLRSLRRAPGFTTVAVLSLAIGIGANSAVFSAASGLLLHPLPYDAADRIVAVWQRSPGIGIPQDWLSTGQYLDIAADNTAFELTAAVIGVSFNLTGVGSPERIDGIRASSSFFKLFGARPFLGATFGAEYDRPGRQPAALLTYGFWVRRFGADRSVVGKTLTLNGTSVVVAGVLSPGFAFDKDVMYAVNGIQRTDVILPLPLAPSARDNRNGEDFNVFAKVRRGTSMRAAQAELDGIAARMRRQYPQFYPAAGGLVLSAVPLVQQVVGSMRTALFILIGAVGLVLLIACANVANLILSRTASQERDLAVRVAIGASGSQIVGGVLAEGGLLAIAGVLAGLVMAFLSLLVLRAAGPDAIPRLREVVVDWRVLVFTTAVACVALLLFAVPPALRAARVDAGTALKAGARGSQPSEAFGIGHGRLQRFLIVGEVTLATVLLVGAGLLLKSYANVRRADPGFRPNNVTTLRLSLPAQQYKGAEAISRFYDDLARRLRSIPGVTAVGMNYQLPLSSVALAWEPVEIEGYVPKGQGDD